MRCSTGSPCGSSRSYSLNPVIFSCFIFLSIWRLSCKVLCCIHPGFQPPLRRRGIPLCLSCTPTPPEAYQQGGVFKYLSRPTRSRRPCRNITSYYLILYTLYLKLLCFSSFSLSLQCLFVLFRKYFHKAAYLIVKVFQNKIGCGTVGIVIVFLQ